ncbi:MAG: M1 family peptidase, partial [Myxococcales bacterium]|nr:M1 family peptidase [Myxococcales bacterium]
MRPLDGHARLGAAARPVQYTLDLHLDPDADCLRGEARITVELAHPTPEVHLHGEGLRIHHALARLPGGRATELTANLGQNGALCLTAATPLPAGTVELEIHWRCPIGQVPEGLYAVRADDEGYLFTQFEPLGARRAFPCFDEPGFKAPFSVSVRAPRGCTVLANTAAVGRRADGEDLVWVFEETPPLPTYLVAFAVGPFDVVTADSDHSPVPLRVITTRGRARLARYALQVTPRLLKALEAWTGVPYPYGKLDLVGVPDFAAGAMENVGLITFRERLLLLDPERAPVHDRMWAEIVIAHELAHMWFGNLVTMAWWDELWLNEAFAT